MTDISPIPCFCRAEAWGALPDVARAAMGDILARLVRPWARKQGKDELIARYGKVMKALQ